MACKRGAGDELLDKFTIKWSVNLLRVPRDGIQVADVFVVQARILDQWDRLGALYRPRLELPLPRRQIMGDMDQVESRSYAADVGLEALQGFLQGLGVPALPLRATIKAARQATVSLSFSVGNVSRTALLPGEIKREMERRVKGARWGSMEARRRYVVAHAVWEATSLQIKLNGSRKTVGVLSASLTNVASASSSLNATHDSSGTIQYERKRPIVFGVQVTGVRFDNGAPRLEGAPDLTPMAVRKEREGEEAHAEDAGSGLLIGRQDGSPFIALK